MDPSLKATDLGCTGEKIKKRQKGLLVAEVQFYWRYGVAVEVLVLGEKISNRERVDDSEKEEEDQHCINVISIVKPEWFGKMSNNYVDDFKARELLLNLSTKAEELPKYSYERRLIKYKRRLFIGSGYNVVLRTKLTKCMLESPIRGHSRNLGTY
ncbi:hypothetical protein ACH5RR_040749 [Cinchona calisaya]|uniref:Uncharacterized protein n=1 Tax=Cinchona calisaya TaxID=153742 RepID=A0ABD2XWS9_9GENT